MQTPYGDLPEGVHVFGDIIVTVGPNGFTEGPLDPVAFALAMKAYAKNSASIAVDGLDGYRLRAICSVLINELNTLRQWLVTFKAQVALTTTLADLKTRVAGLPNTPDRTLAQAKTAYKNAIDGGSVDE